MSHAVTLRPSREVRVHIRRLWDDLEAAGVPLGFDRSLIEPHITLSVVESESDADPARSISALEVWCRTFAAALPQIPLHLPSLGVFPGAQGSVLFIGASSRGPVGDAFDVFHKGLPDGCRIADRIYSPAFWMPHVTLALGLDTAALDKAIRIVMRRFEPLSSDAADLELYELMPVQRVLRIALGPCDCGLDKRTCGRCERVRYRLQS